MPHDQYGNTSCSIHTDFIWRVHNYHRERQIQIASQLSAISSSSLNHNSNTVLVSTPELPNNPHQHTANGWQRSKQKNVLLKKSIRTQHSNIQQNYASIYNTTQCSLYNNSSISSVVLFENWTSILADRVRRILVSLERACFKCFYG